MDSFLESASMSLGFPIDQLKFVLALLAGYPLGLIHRKLPSPTIKHIFSIFSGLYLCMFCLGPLGWIHCFISSTINYLIVKNVRPKTSHKIVFFFSMAYLSISHWYRMLVDYMGWTMDFTAPQMVLTIKMTSFAYNYYDGNRPQEELRPEWKKRAISKLPSLLEFYSYVFFFGGFFGGPAFEIKHYLDFTNKTLFSKTKGEIPSSVTPALQKLLQSFICLVVVVLSGYLPISYLTTEEGLNSGPLYITAYAAISMCMARFKYYFAWLLAEGSCIISGLSYKEDKFGNITWNRLENARVLKTELCQSPRDVSTHWNVQTAKWLKNYVYFRQAPPNKRPTDLAMYLTNLTSAFWHGFYPGYYVAFFTASLVIDFARRMRTIVRPYFFENNDPEGKPLPAKKIYDFLGWFLLWVGMGYAQVSFSLLSWHDSYRFMKACYFWLHAALFGSLILLSVAGSFIRPSKKVHVQ